MQRRGFTLLELLIVVAIIGLLLALLLPSVQYAREQTRRVQCQSHLRQLALGVAQYEAAHRMFPPGAGRKNFSFHVLLLPYVEESPLYSSLDLAAIIDPATLPEAREPQFKLICPSDPRSRMQAPSGFPGTSYAGNSGTGIEVSGPNGVFYYFAPPRYPGVSASDIRDGLSNTVATSEVLVGDGSGRLQRTILYIPSSAGQPFDAFACECAAQGAVASSDGIPLGDVWRIGRPWFRGEQGSTFYNHVLPPGSPSCHKGVLVQEGIFSANSQHSGGVNCAFCDGHIAFESNEISLQTWRSIGSRDGREPVF